MYHNKDVDNKERFKSLKKDLEGKEEWRLRNILVSEEKKIEEVQKSLAERPLEELAKEFFIERSAQRKTAQSADGLHETVDPKVDPKWDEIRDNSV